MHWRFGFFMISVILIDTLISPSSAFFPEGINTEDTPISSPTSTLVTVANAVRTTTPFPSTTPVTVMTTDNSPPSSSSTTPVTVAKTVRTTTSSPSTTPATVMTTDNSPPSSSSTTPVTIVMPSKSGFSNIPATCKQRQVRAQFHTLRIGATVYKRTAVSDDAMTCISSAAVALPASDFRKCAKAAAAQSLNTFYMDNDGHCYGSKLATIDGCVSCIRAAMSENVVYSSNVPFPTDERPETAITSFTLVDIVGGSSFTINFEAECSMFYTFQLSSARNDLGAVCPGQVVPFDELICPDTTFTLTPYLQGVPGDPVQVFPSGDPTLKSFGVSDVENNTFTVSFEPTCATLPYNLFVNNISLGVVRSPKVVTVEEVPDLNMTCAEFHVQLEAVGQPDDQPYVVSETTVKLRETPPDLEFSIIGEVDFYPGVVFEVECSFYTYELYYKDAYVAEVVYAAQYITLPKGTPTCTDLEFTMKVFKNGTYTGYSRTIIFNSPSGSTGTTIPCQYRRARGADAGINYSDATSKCSEGKFLIHSKDLLGSDKTFGLTEKFWVSLELVSSRWVWGSPQKPTMPLTDPMWASVPPTSGDLRCAVYDPVAHRLEAASCLSHAEVVCASSSL